MSPVFVVFPVFDSLTEQPYELIGKQCDNAEHQMHCYFCRSANHDIVGSKVFLESAVSPLCCRSPFVALRFVGCHWNNFFATPIFVNDRNMIELSACLIDPCCIICGIHQIVEIGYFAAGQLYERYGNLAIVQRSRGDKRTDRQADIGYIQMQLEAIPASFVSLGVHLGATVASGWKFTDCFFHRLRDLSVKSFLRCRFPMFVFGRTASLFSWLLWLFDLFGRFLPASDGGSVPTYVSDKLADK